VEYLGGRATPAVGFALGLERLIALLEVCGIEPPDASPHVYLVLAGEQAVLQGMVLADELRNAVSGLSVQANCGGGSFKSQFKRADRSGAELALVIGDEEAERGEVTIKPLRAGGEQQTVSRQDIAQCLCGLLGLEHSQD
jgi:histidyl-tRNA synthetase